MKEKKLPKVSIVVPIYNVEKYLDRCLQSIINQTLREIEIILVDDESPDNCPKICDAYAKIDNRIKVIHKKNEGLGFARNSGMNIATGEYVAFVDSDDYIDLDYYEKLYRNSQNSDLVLCGYKNVDNKGKIVNIHNNLLSSNVFQGENILNQILLAMIGNVLGKIEMGISVWKGMYKRENFLKYKIKFCSEREFISEDYIFHLDYIPICKKIVYVDDVYYYYCDNSTSLTRKYNPKRFENVQILYNEVCRKLKKLNLYEKAIKGVDHAFIGNVRVCIKQERYNEKKIAQKNIKKICNDELVQQRLQSKYNQTISQKIFDKCIQLNLVRLLYFIIKRR